MSLTRDSRNWLELWQMSRYWATVGQILSLMQLRLFRMALIGVRSSWLIDANMICEYCFMTSSLYNSFSAETFVNTNTTDLMPPKKSDWTLTS